MKQLVYQSKFRDVPETLGKMYDRQREMGSSAEPTRDQLLARLAECFGKFDTVFVFVDAFDECPDEERPKILEDLQKLPARNLRLFLTGRTHVFETPELRDDDQLQLWLKDASRQPIHASQEDIVIYLTTTLEKRAKGPEYETLRNRVISEISSRADGQYEFRFFITNYSRFLLATTQLKYLFNFLSQPRKLLKALAELPSKVEGVYENILRCISEGQESDRDLAMRTIAWVYHTANTPGARPLRMEELADLLLVDTGDIDLEDQYRSSPHDIVYYCRDLVVHNEESGVVAFNHFTVHDFLRTYEGLPPISDLAKSCLTYLSFSEFEKGRCADKEAFEKRIQKYKAGVFVAKFWGFYARAAEDLPDMREAICKLLSSENKVSSMLQMAGYDPSLGWEEFNAYFDGETILHILAKTQLVSMCRDYLDGKLILDDKYEHLSICTDSRNSSQVLRNELDVNPKSKSGTIPLHYAAAHGNKELVMMFLVKGADVNAINDDGWTPLQAAIQSKNNDVVAALLDHGADVHKSGGKAKLTALHYAASVGIKEIVLALLEKGADVHVQADDGWTALHYAALSADRDVVMLLLERGADIHAKATDGFTVLHSAALHGDKEVVRTVLDRGADIHARADQGATPLHCAAFQPDKDVIAILLKEGADLHAQSDLGWTALHNAVSTGNKDVAVSLLEAHQKQLGPENNSEVESQVPTNVQLIHIDVLRETETRIDFVHALCVHFPKDHIYPHVLGQALWEEKQYHRAVNFHERSLQMNPVNASATQIEHIQHPEVSCDDCGATVVGIRHICTECFNFDLCHACYSKPVRFKHESRVHEILQVPSENWKFDNLGQDDVQRTDDTGEIGDAREG